MDLDHFLSAKSFKLDKALSLPSRPPFHNTPLTFLLAFVIYIAVYWTVNDQKLSLMSALSLVNAWISHQLRDALRRGLWLYPVMPDTEPLSMPQYLSALFCLFFLEFVILEVTFKYKLMLMMNNLNHV